MILFNMKRLFLLMVCVVIVVLYYLPSVLFHYDSPRAECILRDLDPWDKSFVSELSSDMKFKCATQHPFLYVNDTGYILFNKTALKGLSTSDINCSYKSVFRKWDTNVYFGNAIVFNPPAFIKSRTFIAECNNKSGTTLYKYVHVNIAYNESSEREEQIKPEAADKPSIIIIGLDSISRSQSRRNLNRSLSYMTNTLGAYDFTGYNVVGENTFPNILAMLAGTDWRTFSKSKEYLDGLPFFWKNKTDYATFMCENCPSIAIFNYQKKGFKIPPFDYYLRPAFLAMNKPPVIHTALNGSHHCYGNQRSFDIQLRYLQSFLIKYTNRMKMAFLWNTDLGHNNMGHVNNGDEPLLNFLHWLKSGGHLNNAVLMVISDHGFRLGGASKTPIGRLESTNPMFWMYVPDTLKKKHKWLHANILYNRDKLVTGHDIFPSLLEIMDDTVANARPEDVSLERLRPRRLFWKIPSDRTCEDAGIPYMYCLRCFETTDLKKSETQKANILAKTAVMTLNKRLEKNDMCAQLTLKGIVRYHKITHRANQNTGIDFFSGMHRHRSSNDTDMEGRMYLLVYKTSPGDGLFQALLRCEQKTCEPIAFKPMGMPIRINSYGTQSACVKGAPLKPICFCKKKELIDKARP